QCEKSPEFRRRQGGRPRGSGLNSCSPFYTTTNVSRRRRRAVGLPPRQRSWAAWEALGQLPSVLHRAASAARSRHRGTSSIPMQNEGQREVEARLLAMADALGGKQGLDRPRFFQTAAGMAGSFVAMNEVYGRLFEVSKADAATPAMAQERANALKDQFIMD